MGTKDTYFGTGNRNKSEKAQQKLQKAANQKFMSLQQKNPDESETLGTIEPIIPETK